MSRQTAVANRLPYWQGATLGGFMYDDSLEVRGEHAANQSLSAIAALVIAACAVAAFLIGGVIYMAVT